MKKLLPGRIERRTALGIMSGTSLDGVDVSLARFRRNYSLREHIDGYFNFPQRLRESLLELASSDSIRKTDMTLIDKQLGEFYAESVFRFLKRNGVSKRDIDLIGCHGQTIFHSAATPGKKSNVTLQIGMPDIMAQRFECTVVSDFRTADIAADGMGAPLTPIVHHYLFRDSRKNRMIVNIGGISNATYLPAAGTTEDILATDCGPGNMLIDSITGQLFGLSCDKGGEIAASGIPNVDLDRYLKRSPFVRRKLPISLGREQFGHLFVGDLLRFARERKVSNNDTLNTVSRFTCWCIARVARRFGAVDEVLVCGGGARNIFLMDTLRQIIPEVRISTTDDLGVDPDFVESIAFALLANLAVDGIPGSLIGVTGARRNVILGKITLV